MNLKEHNKRLKKLREEYKWYRSINERNTLIIQKPFIVKKISDIGREILGFNVNEEKTFKGHLFVDPEPTYLRRTFFYPFSVFVDKPYYIEVKGYGANGRNVTLIYHPDGDVNFGLFYKNAKKEYNILKKSFDAGLSVPAPLMLGKFKRETWINSGLRGLAEIVTPLEKRKNEKFVEKEYQNLLTEYRKGIENLENYIKSKTWMFFDKSPIEILKQSNNLGIVVRGSLSPLRLGDPSEKYEFNKENIEIAKTCGLTFRKLIELDYLHLCPSTGNWTLAAEFSDMTDCYDLKKDKDLEKVIEKRENKANNDFWEDLIGERHTSNLSPYFIEGMFGEVLSLKEAAHELKNIVYSKISNIQKRQLQLQG